MSNAVLISGGATRHGMAVGGRGIDSFWMEFMVFVCGTH
jgi:hypothetical protein